MKRPLLLLFLTVQVGCSQIGILDQMAPLPRSLNECSGMVSYDGKSVWVLEDGGNADKLRKLDTQGQLLASLEVKNGRNEDWEALTKDHKGYLYIGDFGNNSNERKDLVVYRVPDPNTAVGDSVLAEKIEFSYPDQHKFPPKKSKRNFDVEAFFHFGDSLYLITKNRAEPFDGTATVYRIPDVPGAYQAETLARLTLCDDARTCIITDAALSPKGDRLVLLSYGKLFVYEAFSPSRLGQQKGRMIELKTNTQLEAVCFASDTLLYLADERSLGRGGYLYRLPLPRPE